MVDAVNEMNVPADCGFYKVVEAGAGVSMIADIALGTFQVTTGRRLKLSDFVYPLGGLALEKPAVTFFFKQVFLIGAASMETPNEQVFLD